MPSQLLQRSNGQAFLRDPVSGASVAISDNDPSRATFSTFITNVAPVANPTDILTLQGSKSKIIRIRQIIITGTATAASNVQIFLTKRSTLNSGGTFTNPTLVSHDTTDDAAACLLTLYSANPASLGTSLGISDGGRLNLAPAANGGIDRLLLQYGWLNDKAPVLNGPNELIAIGLGGAALPAGASFDFAINISED